MASKIRILVAEDEQDIGRLVKYTLERQGYDVHLVGDGQAAVDALERGPFDLVLLDVMMPVMDGYAAAGKISDLEPGLPIVMLSAKAQKVEVEKGYSVGALEYICKPFNPRELVEKVGVIIDRTRGRKD
ncbi:MAG: response regulator [Actinobacteria bacterium]|nr:response regulator [Actinomycetota bacterium]